MARLSMTAVRFPDIQQDLAALPMYRRIDVGGVAIGVVHGDPESLGGWGFAVETLREEASQRQAREWFEAANVQIFACSHTCSPVFMTMPDLRARPCLVANNGAAGMPNFAGRPEGLLTRISRHPSASGEALYARQIGDVIVEALPIRFDTIEAHQAFLRNWPPGSAAHDSYWQRITEGPSFHVEQAVSACSDFDCGRVASDNFSDRA